MALEPRKLNRKELRAIKTKGVDVRKIMMEVMRSAKGEDVDTLTLMEKLDENVMDAILDLIFPNHQVELDQMSQLELMALTAQTLGLTFGGEEEKKS